MNGPQLLKIVIIHFSDMLQQKAKAFISYFKQRKSVKQHQHSDNVDYTSNERPYFNMESFLTQGHHTSTKNNLSFTSSDDENDTVFVWNKKTGEWKGFESDSDYEHINSNEVPTSFNIRDCISDFSTMHFKKKSQKDKFSSPEFELDGSILSDDDEFDSEAPLIAV